MKPVCFIFLLAVLCSIAARTFAGTAEEDGWRLALPGWKYEFPRDHFSHSGFKTEWWYFTGNLQDAEGREFGYQLTFFRQGISPVRRTEFRSRFVIDDFSFAHFAIADLRGGEYRHFQRVSRGSFGEAGFSDGDRIAWIGPWQLELSGPGKFTLAAEERGVKLRLSLVAEKDPVFHGQNGVSQKAEGKGRASHYYSFTRLRTQGELELDGKIVPVTGWSWYDHEWATNQLTEDQTGWDWFSLQFDDGSDLMLFQIRMKDGERDPFSSGTWVGADGEVLPVKVDDFELTAGRVWKSPETRGSYPVEWSIRLPALDLELAVRARLENQEFIAEPISYWEGAIVAEGTRKGKPIRATGYLEMTGYAGRIVGMQAPAGD